MLAPQKRERLGQRGVDDGPGAFRVVCQQQRLGLQARDLNRECVAYSQVLDRHRIAFAQNPQPRRVFPLADQCTAPKGLGVERTYRGRTPVGQGLAIGGLRIPRGLDRTLFLQQQLGEIRLERRTAKFGRFTPNGPAASPPANDRGDVDIGCDEGPRDDYVEPGLVAAFGQAFGRSVDLAALHLAGLLFDQPSLGLSASPTKPWRRPYVGVGVATS